MTTVKDLITHLTRAYDADATIAVAIWQVGDVHTEAQELGLTVTDDVAAQILTLVCEEAVAFAPDTIGFHLDQLDQGGA
ncbi:MAG: hypothetical protein KJ587_16770 [Alphaproteobacteria bacterium]|nr:hypothetical protein [Alphaproteobacteria bacterium]